VQSISTKSEMESLIKTTFVCNECFGSKEYPSAWSKIHTEGTRVNLTQDNPDIFIIHEAPCNTRLLLEILCTLNITSNIYISSIIKHEIPDDKEPTMLEMINLGNGICKEIIDLRPKSIICIGEAASEYMIWLSDNPDSSSKSTFLLQEKSRNINEQDRTIWECPVICTWEPSNAIQNKTKLLELKENFFKALQFAEGGTL